MNTTRLFIGLTGIFTTGYLFSTSKFGGNFLNKTTTMSKSDNDPMDMILNKTTTMSKSDNDPMDMIVDGLKDLTRKILSENPDATEQQVIYRLIELSPGFKYDTIFHDLISPIYHISRCESELQKQNTTKE